MPQYDDPWFVALQVMSGLFIFVIGTVALSVLVMLVLDRAQRHDAIRHNYPVIGRFRELFEYLGVFFRRYFLAMDREELPFNRAQRDWVQRAANQHSTNAAFGSTRDLRPAGTVLFANCPFPTLEEDSVAPGPLTIGPYCAQPYTTASLFNISAMSYGAISRPAVQALGAGAKRAGCWLNTGEGGLAPEHLESGADLVVQIGTANYGVRDADGALDWNALRTTAARPQVRMIELKLSQGAKPGKGGLLPGAKVTPQIATIRGIPVGRDSVSPNRRRDVADVNQLLDLLARLRETTGKPVGVKLVLGAYGWLDELCGAITRRGSVEFAPDFITLDGAEGGSGAAPQSLMDYAGLPLRESLPMLVNTLHRHGLGERVRVIASGKLVTPDEVAWALCAGADFVTSARGFMFALGCIQALRCDRNTCPTGITTHDPRLQQGLDPADKGVRVAQYVTGMLREVGVIAHSCGVPEPRRLRRYHARAVQPDGCSRALDELYGPDPRSVAVQASGTPLPVAS
ncbi:MAG: FMN-binding glutamate synthase family protein [Immundisolibacter sp.]